MGILGNILWFICGGLFSGLSWVLAGLICCITIIGIPFGKQFFKIAKLSLMPFEAEVVKMGLELNAPYELTWSCYEGKDVPCGKCGTCIDRAAAFAANGVSDPAIK